MGNGNPPHQPHSNWPDIFPRWVRVTVGLGVPIIIALFAFFTHTKELEEGWTRVGTWLSPKPAASPPPAAQTATQPVAVPSAPEPQTKVVEVIRSPLPCVDNATEMMTMLRAVGGDRYERQFNKHFKGRETCFVLSLTEVGTQRMHFATKQWWNAYPTYVVQPKFAADLKRFKVGTRLRITGELTRYWDATATNEVDAILILNARVEAEGDGGLATGSIRK